jgi:hypothetical protein
VKRRSLAETHPELAAQADGWDPTAIGRGSQSIVNWLDEYGHRWPARVSSRAEGRGCPYCAGHLPLVGVNDLATTHPAMAAEAHGWDPSTMSPGSHRRVAWRCARGHQWTIAVMDRVRSRGCSVCSGWKVLAGFNDLTVTNPDVAAQADGWDPSTVTAGSSKVCRWRCALGHSWQARVSHRTNGSGCPTCAGRFVEPGNNDLATTHPELAAEADSWDPRTVSAGSGKNAACRCSEGHSWTARIGSRAGDGIGCPTCAGRKLEPGVNDLATTHPQIAKEADGWDP